MAHDVYVFFETADLVAAKHAVYLVEGGQNIRIDKKWSYRVDRTHHDPSKKHVHLICRDNDVAVMNLDGTMSHNTTLDKVPNRIVQYIKDQKLNEGMLIESSGANSPIVPASVIRTAILREKLFAYLKPALFWRR